MSRRGDALDRRQKVLGAILLCGVALGLVSLTGRLIYINSNYREKLTSIAERQQRGTQVLPARRGTILDSRGRVVATAEQAPDVFVDPTRVEDISALALELSARLNVEASGIEAKIRRRAESQYVVVARKVDEVTATAVRELKHSAVNLQQRWKRTYPLGGSLSHVLGWVGYDGHGLEGIELSLDRHLRGKDGFRATIHDARRRAIFRDDEPGLTPLDGGHVVLTIDAEIQRIAEEALAKGVGHVEAESGVAIVMSPSSGRIHAMACFPTFDPNHPQDSPSWTRRNRTITDPTEPGSTFKPFIVTGALEGKFVSTTEQIDCHMGSYAFGSRVITDVKPYGMMDLMGIITKSSNIGMGIIAQRMGNRVLHETVRRFGFGERTGVELPGESEGIVRPLKFWNSFTTQSVAMGYEVGLTPLQLLTGFCAIANDGVAVRPRIVEKLLSPTGEVVQEWSEPSRSRRAVQESVAKYLRAELLPGVVEDGSGKGAKLEQYRVFGKTGTAKLPYEDRKGYEPGAYLGAFLGAAPVEHPELAVLVMIRRPNARVAYYGGAIAAPAVGEILGEALPYLGIPGEEMVAMGGP